MRDDVPVYILSRTDDSEIIAVNASMQDLIRKIVAKHSDNELRERLDIIAEVRANGAYNCALDGVDYNIKRSVLKSPINW